MPNPSRSRGRKVTVLQAVALLISFVLVATIGGVVAAGLVVPAVAGTVALANTAEEVFDDLPDELAEEPLSQRSTIFDRRGRVLATFFHENRIVVALDDIAPVLRDAVIAVEDKRFYEHGGVDPTSMVRAALKTATTDETQGASTLTQQYVKNVLIEKAARDDDFEAIEAARTAEGTEGFNRKLREAKIAIALEKKYTKDEILERYLNIAQFGVAVYGVEAAARYYFGVSAKDLNLVQAATLAGVTQSPTKWDPERNPELSEERRNIVLRLMHEQGYITQSEYNEARATPVVDTLDIQPTRLGCVSAGISAYFCDYVTKILANDPVFGETKEERNNLLYRGGLEIHTTLDPKLQAAADKEVRRGVPRRDPSGLASSLISVEPGSGEILTMVQNRRYMPGEATEHWHTTVNYNTDFLYGGSRGFQPGSTFKTFALVAWLEQENGLNQIIDATRREYRPDSWTASCLDGPPTQDRYNPFNAEGSNSGPISVMTATAFSVNSGYIAMANQMDLCGVFEAAEALGVKHATGKSIDVMPANVLGSQEVSPLTMASAYAALAAQGEYCTPVAITQVIDADGNELAVPQANCHQAISKDVANAVTYALQGVLTNGSARAVGPLPGRPTAGKTGTTNRNAHTWFVGYTPQLATAVWVGHSEGNIPMQNITVNGTYHRLMWGSSIAAPTWKWFMTTAHEDLDVEHFPSINNKMLYGPLATVPDVLGKTEEEARKAMADAGFNVAREVKTEYSDDVRKGRIMAQSAGSGSRLPKGSVITLTKSDGQDPKVRECERWRPRHGPPPDHCGFDWPPDDEDEDDWWNGRDRGRGDD